MKTKYKKYTNSYMKYLHARHTSICPFNVKYKIPMGSWKYHRKELICWFEPED